MKENLFFLFITACILSYCEAISQEVKFITNKDVFSVNEKVFFINTSQTSKNDNAFIWNFGDDCRTGPVYSRKKCNEHVIGKSNEFHVYTRPGTYTISLVREKSPEIYQKQITITGHDYHFTHRSATLECILNTGFENCTAIPYDLGQVYLSEEWYSPTDATPDLFHTDFEPAMICDFSLHIPDNFAGNARVSDSLKAYAGFISLITRDTSGLFPGTLSEYTNYREYIQQRLFKPLESGIKYEVSFYSRLSSNSRYATKIGLCLSTSRLTADSTTVIDAIPLIYSEIMKDTATWVKTSALYTAAGNERYITIGNYSNDLNSHPEDAYPVNMIKSIFGGFRAYASYYYIDHVSIKKTSAFDLERSTILSSGRTYLDTVLSIDYSIGQGIISTLCAGNTSLCLTQGILQPVPREKEGGNFNNSTGSNDLLVYYYPNPTERYLNISIADPLICRVNISVYNLTGNKVMVLTGNKETEDQETFRADLSTLESGSYIFSVDCTEKNRAFFKIVKL